MRIFWINQFEKGDIGMMPRPRGNDWLEDDIKSLKQQNVDTVISLLEKDESEELDIKQEKELCEKWAIEFINYPIQDMNVPTNKVTFLNLVSTLDAKLKKNQKIVVHCRMGIGRSSVLAAAVLVKNGIEAAKAFDILSQQRTLTVPDTDEQKKWIQELENELRENKS